MGRQRKDDQAKGIKRRSYFVQSYLSSGIGELWSAHSWSLVGPVTQDANLIFILKKTLSKDYSIVPILHEIW